LLNASREVAGLLGITVIGAVLSSHQGAALRSGVAPAPAFLDGYHAGLTVTIALIGTGIAVALVALRRITRPAVPATLLPREPAVETMRKTEIEEAPPLDHASTAR
jgi:hypothetical protein